MKLVLVIVSMIAVYTVDCRDLAGEPEDHDSEDNTQNYSGEFLDHDYSEESQVKEEKGHLRRELRMSFVGPYDHIWGDDECSNVGNNPGKTLSECKELCKLTKDCTAFNYREDPADCVLRACGLPAPQPQTNYPPYHGYAIGSRCKARNACVVIGGFCVTNVTLCSGRLVAEGCKGTNCQCCVPGTLELKIQSLEMELQSMKHNLTDTNEDLKMEIQSLKSNNTKANSDLKMELQSMEMNITNAKSNMDHKLDSVKDAISNQDSDINSLKVANSNQDSKLNSMNSAISNQNSKLNSIQEVQDCFLVGSQCFRLYMDTTRTWTSARSKCQSEGLILAEPTDSNAVALRRYVLQKFGTAQSWVGARGDGSRLVWEKRRAYLEKDSSLLQDNAGSSSYMTSSYCLELDALQSQYDSYYSKPYDIISCTTSHFTLCEVVKGIVN